MAMDIQSPDEQTAVIVVNAEMLTNLYGTTGSESVITNSVTLARVRSTRSQLQVRAGTPSA